MTTEEKLKKKQAEEQAAIEDTYASATSNADENLKVSQDASQSIYNTTVEAADAQNQNTLSYAKNILANANAAADNDYETARKFYGETYDTGLSYLENQKQTAYERAEYAKNQTNESLLSQRDSAVIDAESSYRKNKASYGANAETLASMGLTGSGYSDYMDAQAYRQMRDEKTDAESTYQSGLRDSDNTYRQNIWSADDTYSSGKYQLDTEKSTGLYNAETAYNTAKANAQNTYYQTAMESENNAIATKANAKNTQTETNASALISKNNTYAEAEQYKIAQEQSLRESLDELEQEGKDTYNSFLSVATTGEYDSATLAEMAKNQGLTETQIATLKARNDTAVKENTETAYKEKLATVWAMVKEGTVTADDEAFVKSVYGLTDSDWQGFRTTIDKMSNAETEAAQKQNFLSLAETLSSASISGELFSAYKDTIDLTDEQWDTLTTINTMTKETEDANTEEERAEVQKNNYISLLSSLSSASVSNVVLNAMVGAVDLTSEQTTMLKRVNDATAKLEAQAEADAEAEAKKETWNSTMATVLAGIADGATYPDSLITALKRIQSGEDISTEEFDQMMTDIKNEVDEISYEEGLDSYTINDIKTDGNLSDEMKENLIAEKNADVIKDVNVLCDDMPEYKDGNAYDYTAILTNIVNTGINGEADAETVNKALNTYIDAMVNKGYLTTFDGYYNLYTAMQTASNQASASGVTLGAAVEHIKSVMKDKRIIGSGKAYTIKSTDQNTIHENEALEEKFNGLFDGNPKNGDYVNENGNLYVYVVGSYKSSILGSEVDIAVKQWTLVD